MSFVIAGFVLILGAALAIRFPQLADALKIQAPAQWEQLGEPSGHGFADLGRSIGLLFWVLDKQYEALSDGSLMRLGRRAHVRARLIKYAVLLGATLMLAGPIMLAVK